MRVDEISRALASVLRRTYWRMSVPPGGAFDRNAQQIAQSMQDVSVSLQRKELTTISAKLDPGWESELGESQRVNSAVPEQVVNAKIHGQLIGQRAVTAARGWDSEYVPENNAERHPDNRFAEGVSPSGQQIYSPADHVARAFTPSSEDERLALLIARQARAVAPDVFEENKKQEAGDGGSFDFLPLISRGFGLALLIICAALLLSY